MKKLLGVIFGLLLLLVIAALIAPKFISADMVKAQLVAKIETATGRKLIIEGPLSIALFPVASVSAERVSLSNPAGFTDKTPFVQLSSMTVKVALMPLLKREVVIDSFVLEEPRINLHAANGVKNWDFPAPAKTGKEEAATGSSALALPGNIRLSDVAIKRGYVSYSDDASKVFYEVSDLNTQVELNGIDAPLSIQGDALWNGQKVNIKAKITTLQTLLTKAKTSLEAVVSSNDLNMSVSGIYEAPVFSGKADIKSGSLKNLALWLDPKAKPLPTPAPLALAASGDVRCGTTYCEVKNLLLALDGIEAKGSAKLAMTDKPNIDLNIAMGQLDLNQFVAVDSKQADSGILIKSAIAQNAPWSASPIDASALRMLNLDAAIKAEGVTYGAIVIGKSTLNAKIQKGRLDLNIPSTELYSGIGSLSLAVDSTSVPLAIASQASLKGIQLEPLLQASMHMDRLSGTGNLDWNITSRGNSQQAIISALAGTGKMSLANGQIKRVNLLDLLNNLKGALVTKGGDGQSTAFSTMTGSFTIAQGVINNQDLAMTLPNMTVAGKGDVNLPAYTINYRLTPQLAGRAQDGTSKGGLAVPVLISGSLNGPTFTPDAGALLQKALQDPKAFRDELRNTQRSVKDQVKELKGGGKDQLKDVKSQINDLKSLFKKPKAAPAQAAPVAAPEASAPTAPAN